MKSFGWTDPLATDAHSFLVPSLWPLLPTTPARIADLGCGNGHISGLLAEHGHSVVAIDESADGIQIARRTHPSVRFLCCSIYDDLPALLGGPFDLVVSTEVIEHLYEPRKLLANAYRLLRPGGRLLLTAPYHGYLKNLVLALTGRLDRHFTVDWDGGHIKFFSTRSLRRMVEEQGFRKIEYRFAGRVPLLWKAMILQAVRPHDT